MLKLPPEKVTEWQTNPSVFISEILDKRPRWSKQTEIINSVRDNRNTYVKSCHGVGKSFCAKDVILWFLYCYYPSIVLTTAPSWPQVEKLLWAEINNAHSNALVKLGGQCKKVELFLDDNWYALGVSPRIDNEDDGKRLTGFHSENLLVVFDEAPACNPKLWDIKETLMTSRNVRFLAIGNPVVGSGHFYDGFRKPGVNAISMSIFDSPNFVENGITTVQHLKDILRLDIKDREKRYAELKYPYPTLTNPRWAIERLEEWGEDSPLFKSRVIGEFPNTTTDTIISLSLIESCKNLDVQAKHQKVLGVDVARFGSDDTVFYGYEKGNRCCREKFNGQNLVETANRIKHKINNDGYKIIVIDDTGLGGGVTDMIRSYIDEYHKDVKLLPVNFAEASRSDEYDGVVTEMYFNVKKMLEDKQVSVIDDGYLFNELTNRKYKFTNKGKIKIESKDEYKKRFNGKSPDEADAFVLCMWGIRTRNMYNVNTIVSGGERVTAYQDF
jgi:phage terminase large subunit